MLYPIRLKFSLGRMSVPLPSSNNTRTTVVLAWAGTRKISIVAVPKLFWGITLWILTLFFLIFLPYSLFLIQVGWNRRCYFDGWLHHFPLIDVPTLCILWLCLLKLSPKERHLKSRLFSLMSLNLFYSYQFRFYLR